MYYYSICSPKNGNKYHTYFSVIIKKYLETLPNWKVTKNKIRSHFCDCPSYGLIKHQLPSKYYIFYKDILSIILRESNFHPTTFVIKNGTIIDKRYFQFLKKNNTKWFLKPFNGGGGNGIIVLPELKDWKKHVNIRKKYVLQKGIESYLYNGKKFDIRTYILVVVSRQQVYLYMSKDSCMRISSYDYDSKSTKKEVNVTNVCYQTSIKNKKDKNKNDLALSKWEHHSTVQPKMEKIITAFGDKIIPYIKRIPSVALLGCDFIIDKNLNPHFIEINNKIGFSMEIGPSNNPKMMYELIYEIIHIGYEPLIKSQVPPKESKQWIKCYPTKIEK